MQWFKHSSTANNDAKLKRLRMKYGLEGYGLYWYCIELVAGNVTQNKLTFELEHDAEIMAFDLGIHQDKIAEMMAYMIDLELFESSRGMITCLSLAKRADEYTAKALKIKQSKINGLAVKPESVRRVSGECPESVPSKQEEKEETKRKEIKLNKLKEVISNEFERFWVAGMTKQNKQGALKSFTKQYKESKQEIETFTDYLINDVQQRLAAGVFGFDKMHPTTYLNQQRWHDDIVKPANGQQTNLMQTVSALQGIQLAPQENAGALDHD